MRIRQEIQAVPREAELTGGQARTQVVAGILCNANHQILITDRLRARSMQDYWEFPGGKVECGESPHAALCRELAEELGINELEFEHLQQIEHDYPDLYVTVDFFIVSAWQGTPTGIEGQRLQWVDAQELDAGLLLPADVPIIAALRAIR